MPLVPNQARTYSLADVAAPRPKRTHLKRQYLKRHYPKRTRGKSPQVKLPKNVNTQSVTAQKRGYGYPERNYPKRDRRPLKCRRPTAEVSQPDLSTAAGTPATMSLVCRTDLWTLQVWCAYDLGFRLQGTKYGGKV
jgi:hypothetical protein